MLFDAETLARGWLAVGLASSRDDARPQLDRTICIETYPEGVRLVATDSYVLLHSFVPNVDHDLGDEPGLDEAPLSVVVARDPDGRAKGLAGYLLKLAKKNADSDLPSDIEARMVVGAFPVDEAAPNLAGMEAHWVTLEIPDHEKVILGVYDGSYPAWRGLLSLFEGAETAMVAYGAEILATLAKVGRLFPACPLIWHFGGQNAMALFDVGGAEPAIAGAVMPIRTRLIEAEPAPGDAPNDTESGAE